MTYLEKACHFVVSSHDGAVGLSLYLLSLVVVVGHVPATQSGLALSVLQQNESNLPEIPDTRRESTNCRIELRLALDGLGEATYHGV